MNSIPSAGRVRAGTSPDDEAGTPALPEAPRAQAAFGNPRWMGWRLRALVVLALLGCIGLFVLSKSIAEAPQIEGRWQATADHRIELVQAESPELRAELNQTLVAIQVGTAAPIEVDARLLRPSSRWIPSDATAELHRQTQASIEQALSGGHSRLQLSFANGERVEVPINPGGRGTPAQLASLGTQYWLLCIVALLLYVVTAIVVLLRPTGRNLLYAIVTLCQATNLVLNAAAIVDVIALSPIVGPWERSGRMALDLISAAAILHAVTLHPTRLPWARGIAAAGWAVASGLFALIAWGHLPQAWAWVQTAMLGFGLAVMALLSWSYRIAPHPLAVVLRRFAMFYVGAMALLTLLIAQAGRPSVWPEAVGTVGPVIYHVFFASLLLLLPLLSRSQQVAREFALLASVSTVATALDLVFVTVFSFGPFASVTLTLFLALGAYAGVRQWLMNRVLGSSVVTTERLFEHFYRMAREVEKHPEAVVPHLSRLLRELFEPLELTVVERPSAQARVVAQGSTLLVPVPDLSMVGRQGAAMPPRTVAIRFGRRGRRLFTAEDARLADRIVEQIGRAVAFDQAVEQGRSEERARIAQDLHDDIGARLLTLMYQAQTPEAEEYVRHTLLDLKTLTRGLAASSHHLSDAAAEWKADLAQRLGIAHVELAWTMQLAEDLPLTVVQWSGLTRVLRELASNAISHAHATRVSIELAYLGDRLDLLVSDDGIGRNPQAWSHGLGLGGVRKRVKQLGGEVEWIELAPSGIACRVCIREFSRPR